MSGRPFRGVRSGGVRVELGPDERGLLGRLFDQVDGMLDDGLGISDDPLEAMVGISLDLGDSAPGGPDGSGSDGSGPDGSGSDRSGSAGSGPDGPGSGGPADGAPEDPAIARLLPDANPDDPQAAAEFRRLTEHGLRARKRSTLARARQALDRDPPVILDQAEAQAVLKGLTDVRLVLAERLGLRTDEDADLLHVALRQATDADDPWTIMAAIYDTLTWWQESLVSALAR